MTATAPRASWCFWRVFALCKSCRVALDLEVDPTCGMGTLLLAAARVWPQVSGGPQQLNFDIDPFKSS